LSFTKAEARKKKTIIQLHSFTCSFTADEAGKKRKKEKTTSELHQQLQLWWSWKKKNIGSLMNLQLHLWWGLKKNKTRLLM
jgi:hypothetical protein